MMEIYEKEIRLSHKANNSNIFEVKLLLNTLTM